LGTFKFDDQRAILEIDKIYKGEHKTKIIKLMPGGINCDHLMDFKHGEKILIGLNKSTYGYTPDSYFAYGCVTSSLLLTEGNIVKADKNLVIPAFRPQKIGMTKKSMKLRTIEKKISRRIV
jgi:hypothetical protein